MPWQACAPYSQAQAMDFIEVAFQAVGDGPGSPLLRSALHDRADAGANREFCKIFEGAVEGVGRAVGAAAVNLQLSLDRAGRRVIESAQLYHMLVGSVSVFEKIEISGVERPLVFYKALQPPVSPPASPPALPPARLCQTSWP